MGETLLLTTRIVELASYAIVAFFLVRQPSQRLPFACLALAGWLGEESSIALYRFYGYNQHWLIKLHWTPLAVVLVWPLVILSSYTVATRLVSQPGWRRAALTSALVLYDTLVIEPVATASGLWSWKSGTFFDVPLLGVGGWAIFAVAAAVALDRQAFSGRPRIALLGSVLATTAGTQAILGPLVYVAVATGWRSPVSPVGWTIALSLVAVALGILGFAWRSRTRLYLDEIETKILGALVFFALLYAFRFRYLVIWCSLVPLLYWGLAFRRRPAQSS